MKSFMTIGANPKHICACSAYMDPGSNINNLKIRDMKNVKEIIEALRDVDGETMQHILEEVGMEQQMLRQLIMSAQPYQVADILEEKRILSNQGKLI